MNRRFHAIANVCSPALNAGDQRDQTLRILSASLALAAAACCFASPVAAQGLIELFRQGGAQSYAPADRSPPTTPLNIMPISPNAGAVSSGRRTAGRTPPPSPAALPVEEDDHGDIGLELEQPRRVTVALPPPRPGVTPREAAEVAPVGQQRWAAAAADGALPSGVGDVPGLPQAGQSQTAPSAPRLASLPGTQSLPRWTLTDEAPLRPPGLRESETPVANMPGVWAPAEARFQCLPDGLKQVLMDAAKRFGHVAILNAHRGRGTGARGSYHYQCRAVDFRVRGQPVMTVYNFLRDHPNVGGRKIYPMGFFHVDDGPVRSW